MNQLKPGERRLFFSLWAVIAIGIGLWFFARAPLADRQGSDFHIKLGPELSHRIESPTLKQRSPATFILEAKVKPEYQAIMNGAPQTLTLGYELLKGPEPQPYIEFTGSLPCLLSPNEPQFSAMVTLPRPIDFQTMRLFIEP